MGLFFIFIFIRIFFQFLAVKDTSAKKMSKKTAARKALEFASEQGLQINERDRERKKKEREVS